MLPLIPIVIAAGAYVVGKITGEEDGHEKGYKQGYSDGLIQKVTVALRMQCPPEFRDRVKKAKIVRKHGDDNATAAYYDSKGKFLGRAEVTGQGVGKVLAGEQVLSI